MKQWQIYLIVAAIVLLIGMIGGWSIRKVTYHCPAITHDTISLIDTVEYHIYDHVPYYVSHTDTIIQLDTTYLPTLLTKEDTLRILNDYYALHVYDRKWEAKDTLQVFIKDTITQNKSIGNAFTYKILRPETIIQNTVDNSITYNSYINAGITVPFNNIQSVSLDAQYVWNKGYIGTGYSFNEKAWHVSMGVNVFKFKQIKK